MLSNRLYTVIWGSLCVSQWFHIWPISFNWDDRLLVHQPSNVSKVRLNLSLQFIYLIAKAVLINRHLNLGDMDNFYLNMAFYFSAITLATCYLVPTFFSKEICQSVNDYLKLYRYLEGNYMSEFKPNDPKNKVNFWIDLVCFLFTGAMGVLILCILAVVAFFPDGPLSLLDFLPREYFTLPVYAVYFVSHGLMVVVVTFNIYLIAWMVCLYLVYVTIFIAMELHLGRKRYLSDRSVRQAKNLRKIFRAFQLLHTEIHNLTGWHLLVSNAEFMLAPLYIHFVLIREWTEMERVCKITLLIGGVMFMIAWVVILELGRILADRGSKTLGSWKRFQWSSREDRLEMKKFCKSCRPIVVSYGKEFVIGKLSVMKYLKGVTRGVIRALLASRKH